MPAPTLFPFRANGGERLVESYGYLTDIPAAADSKLEQRIQQRRNPVGGVEFSCVVRGQDAIRATALLELHQPELWAVPLWQWATPLTADIGGGMSGFFVRCDPTGIPFFDAAGLGQYVAIWQEPSLSGMYGLASVTEGAGGHVTGELHSGITYDIYVPLDNSPASNIIVRYDGGTVAVEGVDYAIPFPDYTTDIYILFGSALAGFEIELEYDWAPVEGVTTSDEVFPEFKAGKALVIPVRVARLGKSVSFQRHTIDAGQPRLAWRFESVDDAGTGYEPAPPAAPATYQGFELLTKKHSRNEPTDDPIEREFDLLDGKLGATASYTPSVGPDRVQAFHWICRSRADVTALKSFMDRRRGRAIPFWVPSFQRDFILGADFVAADDTVYFSGAGGDIALDRFYFESMFAASGARRHLQFRTPAGVTVERKVIATPDYTTVQLDAALGIDVGPATLVSFLRLCRLDDDEVDILWHGNKAAEATLHFRELPDEAPL